MDSGDLLRTAHEAFDRRDWPAARDAFLEAQAAGPLSGADIERLGDCVWWLGEFRRAVSLYEEAHHLYLREGKPRQAAMVAFAIAGLSFMRGDAALGSGWMSRGARLLEAEPPGAEHGYLLFMELGGSLEGGDLPAAIDQARQLQEIGRRFSDANLLALGILCEGQALLKQGACKEGMRLLDEAMLAAVSDRLAPEWAGNIYCQLMVACNELGDLERARAWTEATVRWCESMPAAGPFFGVCRVHRAQLFQMQGAWQMAESEAADVCRELADFDLATVAEGQYQVGEVRRLRGDLRGAEEAYRQSHALGRDPQPGLALLRLAQDRIDEAHTAIQTALDAASKDEPRRAWLWGAAVEISLAARRLDLARVACDQLSAAAATFETSALSAAAEQARGAVLLREGRAREALPVLRSACLRWQRLGAPYETARVRTLLATAYEALGDMSATALELEAAEQVFRSLGAAVDLRALAQRRGPKPEVDGGLTQRELEVLALVSSGQTNRGIAESLTISEKTVARHLTNIYGKLGVSSRTEAVRFALERGLGQGIRRTS
jgi:ATP/maltotriose-dependent transcriptional regulator MalT